MTADQFWVQDPWLAAAYRKAVAYRSQRKSEEMWLQGMYIYNAVGAVVGSAFRKKGTPPLQYTEEPIRIIPLTEEEKQAKAEEERRKTVAYFDRLAKRWEQQNG